MKKPQETAANGAAAYPKPGEQGGRLIRELVRSLRDIGLELPLTSHILLGCSGGSDSTALTLLLSRYGRRIIPDPSRQLTLLHINHGWRGEDSERDEHFVRDLAARLGLGFQTHRLSSLPPAGASWEDFGRKERKRLFRLEAEETDALVMTAHTADDVAETLLWRIFTGAFETQRAGILPRHGPEARPLLRVRKRELVAFLQEEKQEWREDSTNHEGRFLRSRIRKELMPSIEAIFPAGVEHLLNLRKVVKTSATQAKSLKPRSRKMTDKDAAPPAE